MRMLRWTPDIESSVVPVWVNFPHLPIHFFDRRPSKGELPKLMNKLNI